MKTFDIITEADARVLARGETVQLSARGHVTPLAADTLRERRITILRHGQTPPDDLALAPRADIRTMAIASDHTGIALRRALIAFLRGRGLAVHDLGTETSDPVDYPDVARCVAERVALGEADAGVVIDGAGIGSAMAANKVNGIRAVMATTEQIARYSREHNGANVLALGATLVTEEQARAILHAWLTTAMREPRYIRRLAKIRDIERSQ
jgi:ribose 5-phosphate isomerase B